MTYLEARESNSTPSPREGYLLPRDGAPSLMELAFYPTLGTRTVECGRSRCLLLSIEGLGVRLCPGVLLSWGVGFGVWGLKVLGKARVGGSHPFDRGALG